MEVEYRAITEDQFEAFGRVGLIAFGQAPFNPEMPLGFAHSELDRTTAAFAGDEIVGSGRNYSFELTVPGGAIAPAAGVSWIAVLPTHRRRGVLSGMMAALREDAVAHGEPVSILTASEASIYGRFGYGVASWRVQLHVERAQATFAKPVVDTGRMQFLDRDDALARFPAAFARVHRTQPGMVSRPDEWWAEGVFHMAPPDKACFFVLHEDCDGNADGFVAYEIVSDYTGGVSHTTLQVLDFNALTPQVRAALWQFVFSIDLVRTVSARLVPLDDPLRFLLADPRQLRVDAVNDSVWLQIVDVEGALEARRYSTNDRVVFEIHDGPTVTRVALDGGPDGAQCNATTAEPDVVLGLAQLGAMYLGGTRAAQFVAAGTVEERTPGAVARIDAMFASYPLPLNTTWF